MRDAYIIKGKEITYMGETWVINEFFYVPSNPDMFIELNNKKVKMNVRWDDIKDLVVSE